MSECPLIQEKRFNGGAVGRVIRYPLIQKMMNGFRQVTKRHTNGLVNGLNARLTIQSGSRIIQLPIRNERFELRITAPI